MADTEMLPCPFCGGSDAFVERLDYTAAYVQCDADIGDGCSCQARGPIAVQDDDGEEIPGGAGAIAAWNRRAALASSPAEVDDEGLPPLPEPVLKLQRWGQPGSSAESISVAALGPLPSDGEKLYTAEQFRLGQRDAVESYKMAESFCDANCCWSGHHAECFRSKEVVAPSHTTNKDGT